MKSEIPYKEAKKIADKVVNLLSPNCFRCEIAGSIRRGKKIVGDIEIVAIPKPYQTGLFQDGIAEIVNQWQKVKGELNYGVCKYTQRILPEGIKLDLFFAEEGNWGLIFAIRTGSADYSYKVLASGWAIRGYKSSGGYLYRGHHKFETPDEESVFRYAGVDYTDPINRNL